MLLRHCCFPLWLWFDFDPPLPHSTSTETSTSTSSPPPSAYRRRLLTFSLTLFMPIAFGRNVTFLLSFYERSVSFGFFLPSFWLRYGSAAAILLNVRRNFRLTKIISLLKCPNASFCPLISLCIFSLSGKGLAKEIDWNDLVFQTGFEFLFCAHGPRATQLAN